MEPGVVTAVTVFAITVSVQDLPQYDIEPGNRKNQTIREDGTESLGSHRDSRDAERPRSGCGPGFLF